TLYDYLDKKGFVETYNIDPDSITILGSSSNIYNYKIKEELKYAPEMLFLIKSEYRLSYLFNVGEEMFVKKKLITEENGSLKNLNVKYHELEKINYEN
ncbi:hypothetical protein CU098_008876, partial [Rhizopus stolonifer]